METIVQIRDEGMLQALKIAAADFKGRIGIIVIERKDKVAKRVNELSVSLRKQFVGLIEHLYELFDGGVRGVAILYDKPQP